jgi:small subunit ribosomal protein S13
MIRLLGVDLPRNKKIYISLTSIYGIGLTTSKQILLEAKIDENKRIFELSDPEIASLRMVLESDKYKLEGDLRRLVNLNVKRLIDIGSYRGRRHIKGLPVRGQRSRTNSRTCRLVRVYSGKKSKR